MDAHELGSTYRQYKAATAKLANWLANTARNSGDISDVLPSLPCSTAAKQPTEPKSQTPKVTVSASQLLRLAHIVVETNVTIPVDIVRTTRDAIAGRSACAKWYSSMSVGDIGEEERNTKHGHFLEVLRQILKLLEEATHAQKSNNRGSSGQKVGPHDWHDSERVTRALSNRFTSLELEMPSASPLGSSPRTQAAQSELALRVEDDERDEIIALLCHLMSMRNVRAQVVSLWEKYRLGKLGLDVAGYVTHEVRGLLENEAAQFDPERPVILYQHLLESMCFKVEACGSEVFMYLKHSNSRQLAAYRAIHSLVEIFCPRAYVILSAFRSAVASNPNEQAGFGAHPLGSVIKDSVPDFKALVRTPEVRRTIETGLVGLLQSFADKPNRPILLSDVYTLQTALDTFDTLGTQTEQEMQLFKHKLLRDRRSLFNHTDLLTEMIGPDVQTAGGIANYSQLNVVMDDNYFQAHQLQRKLSKESRESHYRPYSMHCRFPSRLGYSMRMSALAAHTMGIAVCNTGYLVLSMAYLYKMASRLEMTARAWEDMDIVIAAQSLHREFVLEPQNDVASFPKCFGVALGMNLSSFTGGRRPLWPDKDKARLMKPACAVFNTTVERVSANVGSSSMYSRTGLPEPAMLRKVTPRSETTDEIFSEFDRTGVLTAAQIAGCMEAMLQRDNPGFHFDYLQFLDFCIDMLDQILDSCKSQLISVMGPNIKKDLEGGMEARVRIAYKVAYFILWEAADCCYERNIEMTLLWRVAKIIDGHIETKGDACNLALQEELARMRCPSTEHADQRSTEAGGATEADVTQLKGLLGLPAKQPYSVGRFCASKEDFEDRALICRAWTEMGTPDKDLRTNLLGDAIYRVVDIHLSIMTDRSKQSMRTLLSNVMSEAHSEGIAEISEFLSLAGISFQTIFDRIVVHEDPDDGVSSGKDL